MPTPTRGTPLPAASRWTASAATRWMRRGGRHSSPTTRCRCYGRWGGTARPRDQLFFRFVPAVSIRFLLLCWCAGAAAAPHLAVFRHRRRLLAARHQLARHGTPRVGRLVPTRHQVGGQFCRWCILVSVGCANMPAILTWSNPDLEPNFTQLLAAMPVTCLAVRSARSAAARHASASMCCSRWMDGRCTRAVAPACRTKVHWTHVLHACTSSHCWKL